MASPRPQLVLVAALAISTFHAGSVEAQARARLLPGVVVSDSVAWQRILTYVVSSLSTHLVRTASDTSRQPWRISLPPDEPERALIEAQLRTILRARPVVAEDTVVYELEIGPLVVANDTGRVRVRTDFATRCPGTSRSAGFGNIDRVYVVRHPTAGWSVARSEGVLVGDRAGCPSARNWRMVGSFIGNDPDSQGSPGRALVLLLLGFLGGGLVCGSVGAGVGSLIRYWDLVYARPD